MGEQQPAWSDRKDRRIGGLELRLAGEIVTAVSGDVRIDFGDQQLKLGVVAIETNLGREHLQRFLSMRSGERQQQCDAAESYARQRGSKVGHRQSSPGGKMEGGGRLRNSIA